MFFEIPRNLILMPVGAFLLGWILSAISSRLGDKTRTSKRDPRDDRIRSLEAELRVAQGDAAKSRERLEALQDEIKEASDGLEKRDNVITHQQGKIDKLNNDLRDSVIKTRELRAELTERATENVRSEAKLREVKTELEVAQASTDLIATGVLDYTMTSDDDEEGSGPAEAGSSAR